MTLRSVTDTASQNVVSSHLPLVRDAVQKTMAEIDETVAATYHDISLAKLDTLKSKIQAQGSREAMGASFTKFGDFVLKLIDDLPYTPEQKKATKEMLLQAYMAELSMASCLGAFRCADVIVPALLGKVAEERKAE